MSISIPNKEYESSIEYKQMLITFRNMVTEDQYVKIKNSMVKNKKHYYSLDKFAQCVCEISDMYILSTDLAWLCAFDKDLDQDMRKCINSINKCVLDMMLGLQPEVSKTKCFVCDKKSLFETNNLSVSRMDNVASRFLGGSIHYMIKTKNHDDLNLLNYLDEFGKKEGYAGWFRENPKTGHTYIIYTNGKPITYEKYGPVL
jgi:hypothetical protein